MPTMSHTDAQRKAWHAGKQGRYESSMQAFARSAKAGSQGACTPDRTKRGILYATPVPQGWSARQALYGGSV